MRSLTQCAVVAAVTLVMVPAAALAFDSEAESRNSAKRQERERIHQTPEYQRRLDQVGSQNREAALAKTAADPERNFLANVCSRGERDCAGDVRLYDWQANGYGIVEPVLFTARNGATLSGHVWATRSGPDRRPGVVITNGSIQAPEALYWFVAQTLAKAGYVVLTFDPQGQGQSDTPGEAPDQDEGVPVQTDGRPFFDGTVDALDFFLSSEQEPFRPRPSCETGTSHAPKQERRVAEGKNAAFNPFAGMLDRSRVGIAGHSYGARGVSYVGQWDPRVSAVVAWDRLSVPGTTGQTGAQPCPADPDARREVPITKPALGMSADYFASEPRSSDPDPQDKATASRRYSEAGVDSGELAIRGGTHFEFSFLPTTTFDATLRGADLVAWYTTAWFDKYVKGDPERRPAAHHTALALRRGGRAGGPGRRRQPVLVLLPLAPRHRACRGRALRVRGPAGGLRRDDG